MKERATSGTPSQPGVNNALDEHIPTPPMPLKQILWSCLAAVALCSCAHQPPAPAPASAPQGHREELQLNGHRAFIIRPSGDRAGATQPWVWYAPTLPKLPGAEENWMFERFLAAGIAIAGIDVGESYGSPAGRMLYAAFYRELSEHRGFSTKPCLLARSRGGLMLYNWAAENPHAVAGIAGIYPVCDLTSYPGLKKAAPAYGLTEAQLAAELPRHNPIDRLGALADAGVPIFHLHGDRDVIVPLARNSGELARRYEALGGRMRLVVIPGGGHSLWPGWFRSEPLTDFVIARATNAPLDPADFPRGDNAVIQSR